MKLISKTRVDGSYKKKYDEPRTPAERVLEWSRLSEEKAAEIRRNQTELDPFELSDRVEQALKKAFDTLKQYKAEVAAHEDDAALDSEIETLSNLAKPASQRPDGVDRSPAAQAPPQARTPTASGPSAPPVQQAKKAKKPKPKLPNTAPMPVL